MASTSKDVPATEGYAEFSVDAAGKPCKTWYRVVGSLDSAAIPCVLLHGGPGMGHNYLLSIVDLATQHQIPVVFYDQIGCGKSTLLPEKNGDGSFWTFDLFLAELENLLKHLKIGTYDVYGNSWGGLLGAVHAIHRPKGLRKLIIANSPTDIHMWVRAANGLREKLPKDVQETLAKHETIGTTESEEYETAVFEFYKRHVCRVDPMPADVMAIFENLKIDATVYHTM
jgi:proline-specific peptidase